MSSKIKISDKLIIWKIIDGDADISFKSYDELQQYFTKNDSDNHDSDNLNNYNNDNWGMTNIKGLSDIKVLSSSVVDKLYPEITLEEIKALLEEINVAQNLNLRIETIKKHTAYGTNKNKRKLVVKIIFN